ncbi:MAG: type II secretion system F family protein [Planctomycetes bacterium]|nr:type II secretion system F family protein [Planctomycetota bacterium]
MRYRSTILEADGSKVTEELEAADEQSLHELLHRDGRMLLRSKPLEDEGGHEEYRVTLSQRRLLLLTQAMQEALDAGVPLLTAFEALGEQEEDDKLAWLLADVGTRVSSGQQLSDALAAHPRAFPSVYCALVKAGEQSGSLPSVLQSIAGFIEWKLEIGGVVKQAMIYPIVVASAGYGMVLFMLSFVVPRLGSVLQKIGGELPAASRLLIGASGFVAEHILLIVIGSVAALVAAVFFTRTARVRDLFVSTLSGLPVVSHVVGTLAVAQFARTFSVLLQAGLTMTHALELGAAAVGSPRFRKSLLASRDRIVGGARLGEAFAEVELLPPVALSMVKVGEEAGRLPITFERLGRLYDREVKAAVRRALALLEPIVTVLLGLIVGGIAVLVVTTIYTAMKGVGK